MTNCPTPASGWRQPDWYPATHGDVRAWAEMFWGHLLALEEVINVIGETMGQREEAVDARLVEIVGLIRDHLAGKDARIAELEAALEAADAAKAAELTADSDADAARKEEVAAALESLLAPPAEPEPAPEEPTEPEQPADPGSDDVA